MSIILINTFVCLSCREWIHQLQFKPQNRPEAVFIAETWNICIKFLHFDQSYILQIEEENLILQTVFLEPVPLAVYFFKG